MGMGDMMSFYSFVDDLMSEEEFRQRVRRKVDEFGGLITEEAAAYLVVDEAGRNPGNRAMICELVPGKCASVEGTIVHVGEERETRKGRVQDIVIRDDTGECVVSLWDDDLDELRSFLRPGARLRVINGFVKLIYGRITVQPGRWGIVVVEKE